MEVTLLPSGPVDSEYVEVWWSQCPRYRTKVNFNNRDNCTQEQLQVILHYPDQGNGECAADPVCGKKYQICSTAPPTCGMAMC